jgi:hypothetical protein
MIEGNLQIYIDSGVLSQEITQNCRAEKALNMHAYLRGT